MNKKKLIILVCILFSHTSFGNPKVGYYSNDLLPKISAASSNLQKKELLFQVTKKNHQSLAIHKDYIATRKFLFGKLFLQKDDLGFYVYDFFCGIYFRNNVNVGPDIIPNYHFINTEHSWPRSKFSQGFSYQTQLNDLHHLFPVQTNANSLRSNLPFGEVYNHIRQPSNCPDSQKGFSSQSSEVFFEPLQSSKGDIARAIFYFSIRYQLPIYDGQEQFLRLWHEEDPVDPWEKQRNNLIMLYQGNRNPFIDLPQLINYISDF